jgi:hypothetical protein
VSSPDAGALDLYHVGAEIGEKLRAPGSGKHPAEVKNTDAGEGFGHDRF